MSTKTKKATTKKTASARKAKAKSTAKKVVAKKTVAPAAVAERDAIGSRIGSKANRINEVLLRAKKAHMPKEIAEKADVPVGRVRQHLAWLQRYEAIDHTEDGWKLKGNDQVFGIK